MKTIADTIVGKMPRRNPEPNSYRVPVKQWRKWSETQRRVFNLVYESMSDQRIMHHPKATMMPTEHWTTVQWNAAWIAADALKGWLYAMKEAA